MQSIPLALGHTGLPPITLSSRRAEPLTKCHGDETLYFPNGASMLGQPCANAYGAVANLSIRQTMKINSSVILQALRISRFRTAYDTMFLK